MVMIVSIYKILNMERCQHCNQPMRQQQKNTVLLIDGENFKGKINDVYLVNSKKKPVWHTYDFKGLLDKVLTGLSVESAIFYFAKIKEHPETREKSRKLIESQRLLKTSLEKQGFEVVQAGRVRGQKAFEGSQFPLTFREKGVDVKIGVDMVSLACDERVSTIVLGSSDSDLQPAIKEASIRGVECIYLGFEVNPNKGLSYTCKRTILIRNSEVLEFGSVGPTLFDEKRENL